MQDDKPTEGQSTPDLAARLEREEETLSCPKCKSHDVIHFGSRDTRGGRTQIYRCKGCKKRFTTSPIKNISYPVRNILRALTLYDQGNSIYSTAGIMKRKYKTDIPHSTLSNWIKRYERTFTFLPLRKRYKIDPEDAIQTKRFHHQQVYDMRYHRLKLNIAAKAFPSLPRYIYLVANDPMDDIFKSNTRCSLHDFSPPKVWVKTTDRNNATELTTLAETLARTRQNRHDEVERFFLINDAVTFATELPVYLDPQEAWKLNLNVTEPLTGHIDLLQFRNGKVYVMDYKPDDDPKDAVKQLTLYAYCLRSRTGISLKDIRCAAFNSNGYVEFGL